MTEPTLPHPANSREYLRYRLLEMVPGALVWATFVAAFALTLVAPRAALVFIIGFDLIWLVRVLYTVSLLVVAYRRYRRAVAVNWGERMRATPGAERLHHAILLPIFGEDASVLRQTLEALSACRYPQARLTVVLATEGREAERIRPIAREMEAAFASRFGAFLTTEHPAGLPGEVPGKGSNIAWAGERLVEHLAARGIPIEDVLVTTLDVDTVVHPDYFAHLSVRFATTAHPLQASYQPIPVFANNLAESPLAARVVSMGTTFWLLAETARPERLFTFSSHSTPLRTLVDVGFWQRDIVTEDSRIFVQGLLHYDGDYRVVPLYLPVSMDAVHAGGTWATLVALYKQQRRWAYGVENFPFMAWNFAAAPRMPWAVKLRYLWNQLEGVYSWATAPILIFALGWIPLRLASVSGASSAFLQAAPQVLHWILTISLIGLVVSVSLTLGVIRPARATPRRRTALATLLSWVLFPIAMVLFGSIPATDAVTRLALGHYLGFNVTRKFRAPVPAARVG